MKKFKLTKKVKIIISLVAVLVIAIGVAVALLFLNGGTSEQYDLTSKNTLYEDDATKYKEGITDDNGNTLLYNSDNGFVAIKKADNKSYFLPCSKTAKRDGNSAVLKLVLRDKNGNSYILNSTDNSVAFNTFKIAKEKNSLIMTFSFFKDENSAKEGFKKNGFCAEIPLVFSTEDGNIKASINCENINLSNGLIIEKISILPGLFSVNDALNGEHFVIPDGAGALVDLSAEVPENVPFILPVYGSDVAVEAYNEGAFIPCYAYADKKTTNSVIISSGEALATIYCNRNKNVGEGNLYSEFTLTAYSGTNEESSLKIGEQYKGELALTYIFSETEVNSYSTLALIARDYFIKAEYLSDSVKYDFGDLPFFVNVIGSEKGKRKSLTTFEDASEIVSLLNSKGVRNVSLRISGALNGGLRGGSISKSPALTTLGGDEALKNLCEIAKSKKSSVWIDINAFSGGTAIANASGIVKSSLYKDVYPYMAEKDVLTPVSDSSIFGKNISSTYAYVSSFENLNVALNDASFLLFTDTNRNLNRQQMLDFTKEKVSALSISSALMLDKPALWLMKDASCVYSVPQLTSKEGAFGVTTVPLLQMVLHGSVIYGCEPVNAINAGWNSILKSVEYGAVPSFLFTYEECNNLSYGRHATVTAQYYSKLKSLKTIQGTAITSHEKLLTGVYKTTYAYNKVVYVNYNDSVVTVDGILLSPNDFILV